ncbi:hypothetical protein [Hoeflea sp.]|uniref:hypothetical protein n=1 Tax=Hoeflea sp. TaxID=1940281 RepID=UPI003B52FA96
MSIETDIRHWNGKSAQDIRTIYSRHHAGSRFTEDLVKLCADHDLETGATWLVKHHLEVSSATLDTVAAKRLVEIGNSFTFWEARLHLLQMLDRVELPPDSVEPLAQFVETCLEHRKTLVRAWSYHGLHHLARLDPSRQPGILATLHRAEETEHAASAKVRLRKALAAVSDLQTARS